MYYLIQRNTDEKNRHWEEVDEYVFKNYTKAITSDGGKRYTNNRAVRTDDGRFQIIADDLSVAELAYLARFAGITSNDLGVNVPGGFIRTVESVKFKIANSNIIHEINGETYRATVR